MIFVISITLLLHLGVALRGTVHVPSGNASSLETYLCNGSLTSGTTLILGSGTHIIPTGPACYLTDLSNVAITTSSNATVQCTGERMFHFRGMQNFTIENVTFTECGQLVTIRVRSKNVVASSVVIYFEYSLSVSMRKVAITRFKGFAVVGYNLSNFVMSDVKISECANNNCSGVYLESALDTVTFERCEFSNLLFNPSYSDDDVKDYFGPGITMFDVHARVHNSVFTSNQGGSAVSAYSSYVDVLNSTFTRNIATWGGAISSDESFHMNISSCTFRDNYAEKKGGAVAAYTSNVDILNSTFRDNYAKQSGGAIEAYTSNVDILNSKFTRNIATWGGAISSMYSHHLNVSSCTFRDNYAYQSGGAIYQGLVSKPIPHFNCTESVPLQTVTIDKSSFHNNTAKVGGAIFAFDLQYYVQVTIRNSAMYKNTACVGAAIYAGNGHIVDSELTFFVVMEDVSVINNTRSSTCSAWGGAVYLNEVDYIRISGLSSSGSDFVGNSPDGAIQAIGTNVHLQGNVSFRNNSAFKGGALYLTSNAQLYFDDNCNVKFSGNTANASGGAVYIQGDRNINIASSTVSDLVSCAIHIIANNYNFNVSFSSNHADQSGHSVYATNIYECQLNNVRVPQDVTYDKYFTILPAPGDSNETQIMSFPVKVLICSCEEGSYLNGTYHITAWPGATIRCNATTVDFESHTSPSVVYTTVQVENSFAQLGPQQEVQWAGHNCTSLEYQIYGLENTTVKFFLSTDEGDTSLNSLNITVMLEPCGPGFMLSNDSRDFHKCTCSLFLTSFGINCDANLGTVNRTDTTGWIGLLQNGAEALATTCPLDYCNSKDRAINLQSPNSICNGGREGVLCGHCPAGQSVVFGSTECHLCSDVWLITLGMYAVMGVVLIVVLFVLNLTVNQGTIYGLIFYANIIVVNSTVFFGGLDLKFLQVIISFIILDLGFPLCFYNGMDDAAKMGLQFAFPTYLLFLIIIFIVVCRHCISSQPQQPSMKLLGKLRKFTLQKAVNVLATLVYLSYFKLVRAVIDILSYTAINVQNGASVQVWFYDGNIQYLHGVHAILFGFAIATSILFIIPYTIALTIIPIIDRFSESNRLLKWINFKINLIKPMNDAYYAPYNGWRRSWLGLQLLLFIFLLVPSPILGSNNPSLLLFIHVLMLSVFAFLHIQIRPFGGVLQTNSDKKCKALQHLNIAYNWLDLFYIINYTLLAFTVSYLLSNGSRAKQLRIVVGLLVGIAVFVFWATILLHTVVSGLKLCNKFELAKDWIESLFYCSKISIVLNSCPEDNLDENKKLLSTSIVKLDSREPLLESEIN